MTSNALLCPPGKLTVLKPADDGTGNDDKVLLRRTSDGEVLLGELLDNPERAGWFMDLMDSRCGAVAANLLNHENLVSIAGVLPSGARGRRYLVWDYCDAGTFEMLLREPPNLPRNTGFLPASLYWHVALSLLRAFA